LADDLAVSPSHLSEIERWENEPSFGLLKRLHTKTGIDINEFVKDEKERAD
jgi:transcriptional regulator with XRE-family HTH domain